MFPLRNEYMSKIHLNDQSSNIMYNEADSLRNNIPMAVVVEGYAVHEPSYSPNSISQLAHQQSKIRSGTTASNQPSRYNESAAREFLTVHKWPKGLQDTFLSNLSKVPIRFFICDDSGSMITNDGHRLIETSKRETKLINCTRWAELTESLKFHAGIAHATGAPSEFRLLNGAPPIMIGDHTSPNEDANYRSFLAILDDSPSGGTPLCKHIREVIIQIESLAEQLRANNQRAVVIIATDGESSDGDIANALRPLKDLPAWLVIRLCTDENNVVQYWNNVDNELEVAMDVLDDLCGEAAEVYEVNPWLTYGEPMHRLREFGIPTKEIDLLDETLLSTEQIRLMCSIIFGSSHNSYPHPDVDWPEFVRFVKEKNNQNGVTWNPITRRNAKWVDVDKIAKGHFKKNSCSIL